jgi:hypothetical protein
MTNKTLRVRRDAFAHMLRATFEDVTEDDVAGAWERFRPELRRIVAARPLRPGEGREARLATVQEWLRETNAWVYMELLHEVIAEEVAAGCAATGFEVGPAGKLCQWVAQKGEVDG